MNAADCSYGRTWEKSHNVSICQKTENLLNKAEQRIRLGEKKQKKRAQLKKTVKEQEHKRRDFVHILAFKMSGLGLKERQAIGRLLGPIGELEGKFLSSPQHVGQLQTQNLRDVTEGHKHTSVKQAALRYDKCLY